MKIAYLVNQYPWVSHSFIRREIAAMESLGHAVSRYSIRDMGREHTDEADQREAEKTRVLMGWGLLGASVRIAARRPTRFLGALRLAWRVGRRSDRGVVRHLAYLAEACRLLGWLEAEGCHHLHAHFGTNPAAVAMLCRELGGPPYSFTVHGPDEFDRAPLMGFDEKIARAAFVAAISDYCRSQLFRWCDSAHWGKIQIVRCGLDERFFDAAPSPVPDAPRLVCVGRLSEQKGQLLLVEAAGRLRSEGLNFQIVLVGDGPMRAAIERLIERHGLGGFVVLRGWASNEEVRREILASRAMVLPSFAEGLPVVIMEAMALGRPVVSTCITGIPELVRDGVNGWLVTPGSVDELTRAMREVLRLTPGELTRLGEAGRQAVATRHRSRIEAEKLTALLPVEPLPAGAQRCVE